MNFVGSLLLLLVLGGCGASGSEAEPGTEDASFDEPWVELGVGEYLFESVEDGAVLELIRGSQGGYHVILGVRGRGFDAGAVELTVRLEQRGDIVGGTRLGEVMALGDGGHYTTTGIITVFDIASPAEVDGVPTTAYLELTDRQGDVFEDTLPFVPRMSLTGTP